jgi:hypothetical protein
VSIELGNEKIVSSMPVNITETHSASFRNMDSSSTEYAPCLQSPTSPVISMCELEVFSTYEDVSEIPGNQLDNEAITIDNYIEPLSSVVSKERHSIPASADRRRSAYLTAIQ